ncbi:MAG TPA: DUF4421 domain-containing protein [Bacteroides sp.]|nr:DUF4421 domain-containing protein [Bacteroides sp.]
MKWIRKIIIGVLVILFPLARTNSQFSTQMLQDLPTQEVDSNYVNLEENILSLRTFLVLKSQSFKLRNNKYALRYTPNNRFGVGVGFAYYPILLDFAINLKVYKENASERLDIQGELLYKRSLFTLYFQDYTGFNITGDLISEAVFRPDIESLHFGFSYFRVLNASKMSFRSVFAGGAEQKKSVGSFALGGAVGFQWMRADSSIVPSSQQDLFNDYAMINEIMGFNVIVKGGYSHVFVLPDGFFVFASVYPGIGIFVQKITSHEIYFPSDYLNLNLDLQIAFGYNGSKMYSTLGFVTHHSDKSLDYSNHMSSRLGRVKLVFGFKL